MAEATQPCSEERTSDVEKATLTRTPSIDPTPLPEDALDGQGLTFIVELNPTADNVLQESDGRKEHKHDVVRGELAHSVQDPSPKNLPSIDPCAAADPCLSDSDSQRSPVLEPPGLSSEEFAEQHEEHTALEGGASSGPSSPEEAAPEHAADAKTDTSPVVDLSGYSLSDLPKLDRFIPDDLLPDDLLVHDVDNLTHPFVSDSDSDEDEPKSHVPAPYVRYVRIFPNARPEHANAFAGRDPARPVRTAHLYLKRSNKFGAGNHSDVYRAPFSLRLDPESQERSVVSVAVKTAHTECGAHYMLNQEAETYNALPRSFMEDTYPPPRPSPASSPASASASAVAQPGDAGDSGTDSSALPAPVPAEGTDAAGDKTGSESEAETETERDADPEPAVVPKFYGYYAALAEDGTLQDQGHSRCDEEGYCTVKWPTRLLLLEECGTPISSHLHELSLKQREQVLSLFRRLHEVGVVHLSSYLRNMLMQPGPLSVPRPERSQSSPSFRLIDFGRSQLLAKLPLREFQDYRRDDLRRARRELNLG